MKRGLIAGFFAAVLLAAPATMIIGKAADRNPAQAEAYASSFDEFLGFIGGVPLNAGERQLVAVRTAADLRADPSGVQRTDESIRKKLAKLHAGDASYVGEQREALRLQMAMLPDSNLGRQLVERNDPTVVFDQKHRRLITESSLAALQRACTWMAQVLVIRAPDATFVARQRTLLRDNYDRLSDAQQEALTHVERDVPVLIAAYDKANAAKQVQFAKAVRPYVHDGTQLAPLTVAILGATHSTVQTQIINDSIVLMGATNTGMLLHGGYYHNP